MATVNTIILQSKKGQARHRGIYSVWFRSSGGTCSENDVSRHTVLQHVAYQPAVHQACHEAPETALLEVAPLTDTAEQVPQGGTLGVALLVNRAAVLLDLHQFVEAERHRYAHEAYRIGLPVDANAQLPEHPPHGNDQRVDQEDGQRCAEVGEAHVNEQVVEVRLVRMEGGCAAEDAHQHHAERVEHWDAHDGQRQRRQAQPLLRQLVAAGVARQREEHEHRHQHAEHQRAAVADEHLGAEAEHVVEEEGHQRTHHDKRKADHFGCPHVPEHQREHPAGHHSVPGGVAVHAVYQVHRIDQPDAGHHGQGDAHHRLYLVDAPEPVQVVDVDVRQRNESTHQPDLYHEAERRGEVTHVVPGADDHHQRHAEETPQEHGVLHEKRQHQAAGKDARVDHGTAKDGDRDALELPRVGVVYDAVRPGEAEHGGEGQRTGHERHRGHEDRYTGIIHTHTSFCLVIQLSSSALHLVVRFQDLLRPLLVAGLADEGTRLEAVEALHRVLKLAEALAERVHVRTAQQGDGHLHCL